MRPFPLFLGVKSEAIMSQYFEIIMSAACGYALHVFGGRRRLFHALLVGSQVNR